MSRHTIADVTTGTSRFAREVVARRVAILAGLPVVLTALVAFGVPLGVEAVIKRDVAAALDILGVLAAIVAARRVATPADPGLHPTDKYGNPLVSDISVGPHGGNDTQSPASAAPQSPADAARPSPADAADPLLALAHLAATTPPPADGQAAADAQAALDRVAGIAPPVAGGSTALPAEPVTP